MTPQRRTSVHAIAVFGFVLLSSLYSGCQTLETHHSYDSYYEHDGMWCGDYRINFRGARAAALTALTELKMPVYREGPLRRGIYIDTRTPENFEARVIIMPTGRYGEGARICVRVGGFGTHRQVCERLLDEIARHLDAVPVVPMPPPPGAMPGSPPVTTAPPSPQSQSSDPSLPPQPVPLGK